MLTRDTLRKTSGALALAVGLTALAAASAANAVTSISSSGYGLGVDLTVLGFLPVTLEPLASASGSSPPGPYNSTNSVLLLNTSLGLAPVGSLQTGTATLTGSASSPFTPTPTGTASGTVNNLSGLTLLSLLGTELGVSATTISSTSSVSGSGALSAFGSTTIEDLVINGTAVGSTITVGGAGAVNPGIDDVIFNSGGLEIELNRQTPSGNGITSDGITTDALYIDFSNFALGTGLLNGDIILGQSQANIVGPAQALPEPGAWALMLVGFAGLGGALRARRRLASMRVAT